jgi:hypothetical protein
MNLKTILFAIIGSIYIFNISGHAKRLAPGETMVGASAGPPFLSTRPTNLRTKASRPSSKTASATSTRTTTNAAKGSVQNKDRVSSFCWPKNSNQDPNGMNINFLDNDNKKRG